MFLEMVQHQPREAETTKLRPNIHAFDLSILIAKKLHATATDQRIFATDDEKEHTFSQQLFHAVAVPAFSRVKRIEVCFELCDQCDSILTVRGAPAQGQNPKNANNTEHTATSH